MSLKDVIGQMYTKILYVILAYFIINELFTNVKIFGYTEDNIRKYNVNNTTVPLK